MGKVPGWWAGAALLAMASSLPAGSATVPAGTAVSRRIVTDYARMRRERPDEAWTRFLSPDLIQHNPEIAEGIANHAAFLERRRRAHPGAYLPAARYANVIDNILADGDLVAIKSRLFTSPQDRGRAFVDIWRIAGGKFVEHWDVIEPLPADSRSGGSMGCSAIDTYAQAERAGDTAAAPTCGTPGPAGQRARSLAVVRAYLTALKRPGGASAAVDARIAADYVEHSPRIGPGREGLRDYLAGLGRSSVGRRTEIGRVLADGNLVLVHGRIVSRDDPRGSATVDLYRVRDGRIVEHWDLVQPIPAFSVSGRPMVTGTRLEPGRKKGPAPAP